MLRMIFVIAIILVGAVVSTQGAFYGLLFYLWNAYFRPESWVYGGSIISLRLSLIIGAYVVFRTILSVPNPKLNRRTILLFLFFVQAVIGVYTSEYREWSWDFLTDFAKVLLITYLIVVLVNDRKQFRLVLLVIAFSLGFETAKQGWANLYFAPGAKNDNTSPFLGDNNGVAVGTMMLVPLLGALAQTAGTRWERWTHRFVSVGVFMRGITTYSRGGFLGAGALALVSISRAEKKFRAIFGVAMIATLVWSVMPDDFWNRMNTITADEEHRDDSSAGRLHFWQVGAEMGLAKPLTGVGLNNYNNAYEAYNTDDRFTGIRSAHSAWFGVLGDLGFPGLVLFVGNIVMAFWSCWQVVRMARSRPELRELKIYANGLISALIVFTVSASFLSSQYNEMLWHLVGISIALHLIAAKESLQFQIEPRKVA